MEDTLKIHTKYGVSWLAVQESEQLLYRTEITCRKPISIAIQMYSACSHMMRDKYTRAIGTREHGERNTCQRAILVLLIKFQRWRLSRPSDDRTVRIIECKLRQPFRSHKSPAPLALLVLLRDLHVRLLQAKSRAPERAVPSGVRALPVVPPRVLVAVRAVDVCEPEVLRVDVVLEASVLQLRLAAIPSTADVRAAVDDAEREVARVVVRELVGGVRLAA